MQQLNVVFRFGKIKALRMSLTLNVFMLSVDANGKLQKQLASGGNSTTRRVSSSEQRLVDVRGLDAGRIYPTEVRVPNYSLFSLEATRTFNGQYTHRCAYVLRVREGAAFQSITMQSHLFTGLANSDTFTAAVFSGRFDLLTPADLAQEGISLWVADNADSQNQLRDLFTVRELSPQSSKPLVAESLVTDKGIQKVRVAKPPARRMMLRKPT